MLRKKTAMYAVIILLVVLLAALGTKWDPTSDSVVAQTSDCSNGIAVPDPANSPDLVSDCDTLLAVRDTLAGAKSLNWSDDRSITSWRGVTVDRVPLRVTKLNLNYDSTHPRDIPLTGSIPDQLGTLTGLEEISLSENQLTGHVPSSLGNLSNLRVLALGENDLTGPIPSSLGSLSELRVLDLGGNDLHVGPIPDWLGKLSDLETLSLYESRMTGPFPEWLGDLSNLKVLVLVGNQLTGPIPTSLGSLHNLEVLLLSGNGLTGPVPDWLGGLSNLRYLHLSANDLTGHIPSSLGRLDGLESLELAHNRLIGPIPTSLGDLSGLRGMHLSGNDLTGLIPSSLGSLSSLETLGLGNNELIGAIPSSIGNMSSLEFLYLSENQLTGAIPSSMGNMSSLEVLNLSGNALTGEIPVELGNVSRLWLLDLSSNQLTGSIPSSLGRLSNLIVLLLSENLLTGCVPSSLQSVRNNDLDRLGLPLCTALPKESPTIDMVTAGFRLLTIAWSAPDRTGGSAIISYDLRFIETSTDNSVESNWTLVQDVWTTGAGALSYDLTGLTNGVQYDLQLRAVNASGAGPWSAMATGTPTEEELPPASPSNAWYFQEGSTIVVRWEPSVGASHYKVYHDETLDLRCGVVISDIPGTCQELAGNVVGTSYTHTSPSESENYYWVSACNNAGCSDIEGYNPAQFVASAPGVPTLASVTARVDSLVITWGHPEQTDGSAAASYDLRHIETSANEMVESNWTLVENIWTTGSGALRYEVGGLRAGTQYDMQVRAVNPAGNSPWSDTFTGLPGLPASTRAIRSISPSIVEPRGEIEVTVTVDGFGWLGFLVETLPDGFRYASSTRPNYAVQVTGQQVRFFLLETAAFTYTVIAPALEGPYLFSGTMTGFDRVDRAVGGVSSITVQAEPSVGVYYAPGGKASPVRIGSPVPVMVAFSEPVYEFSIEDIVVANGSASNLIRSGDGNLYTLDVTPNAVGVVTVDISADVAEDGDGNGNTAADQFSIGLPYDDDRDGAINGKEVLEAVSDYFNGSLTGEQALAVVHLYFSASG